MFRETKLKHAVGYENILDEFNVGHFGIKVKVTRYILHFCQIYCYKYLLNQYRGSILWIHVVIQITFHSIYIQNNCSHNCNKK